MTNAPPQSLDEEAHEYAEAWDVSLDEARQKVAERRERATARNAELRESTDPAVLLPAIRSKLGLHAKINRIVATVSTPAHYRMETAAGTVVLGPASRWASRPTEFAAAFLDIREMPTLPKPGPARNDLCTMIARAAEPENIGDDATDDGWTRAMLRHYLDQRPPVDDATEALGSEYPFTDADGHVTIFGTAFRRWLLLTHAERLSPADCGRRLRGVGCEPLKVNTGKGADRTSRGAWKLPTKLTAPDDE